MQKKRCITMKKEDEIVKRLFPDYFERFEMPEGAKEEAIKVYRACKTWECDKESFTPTFEEQGCVYLPEQNPTDPGIYSLSTAEKPRDIKRFVTMNSEYNKPHKIAYGVTAPEHGIAQRTKERIPKRKDSHVDWWLYKGAKPYECFEMIQDFEKYYEEYKEQRAKELEIAKKVQKG